MKKAPNLYRIEGPPSGRLEGDPNRLCVSPGWCSYTSPNGKNWIPARPTGFFSLRNRLKLAWGVFTGRYDAVLWPTGTFYIVCSASVKTRLEKVGVVFGPRVGDSYSFCVIPPEVRTELEYGDLQGCAIWGPEDQ